MKRPKARTNRRRTKEEIDAEEGFLVDGTYLRINALKHRWDWLLHTVSRTGYANVRATDGLELDPDQIQQITEMAARWGMGATLTLVGTTWHLALNQRPPEVPCVTGGCDPPDTSVPDGGNTGTVVSIYTRIDALLKQLLEEVDKILGEMEDHKRRPAFTREVYRRIGNVGQDVMDRCATCTKELEENW